MSDAKQAVMMADMKQQLWGQRQILTLVAELLKIAPAFGRIEPNDRKQYYTFFVDAGLSEACGHVDVIHDDQKKDMKKKKRRRKMRTSPMMRSFFEKSADTAEQKDDETKSCEQFDKCLKLGVHEDSSTRKVAELLRFHTSTSGDELIGLKEYVDCMKEGQNDLYCITSGKYCSTVVFPFLENLRKGREMLYMMDPIDDYAVQQIKKFNA